MDFNEILRNRQSIRKFKDEQIPDADLHELAVAAGTAPSGKNIQNWHFTFVKNQEIKDAIYDAVLEKNEEISKMMDEVDKKQGDRFRKFAKNFTLFITKAPVLAVIMTETYTPSGYKEYELINADRETLDDLISLRNPGMQNLGAAIENLTLKAVELGYGSCWLTSANYAADKIENILRNKTGFDKEGYFLGALMAIGKPSDDVHRSPVKKAPEDIYTIIE